MPHHVAQRLLQDPVGGQVHALRQGPGGAADGATHEHAPAAGRFQQPGQLTQARLRGGGGAAAAQHAEEPAQFAEPAQRAGPDVREALQQLRRGIRDLPRPRLGLDGDHRHVVGHDVVQFAGDALAFLEQRALAFEAPGLLGELGAAAAPDPDDRAGEQRDGHEERARAGPRVDEDGAQHGEHPDGRHEPGFAAQRDRVQAQRVHQQARRHVHGGEERARPDGD